MISPAERSDIIHIMKMNRFSLIDSDSAQLCFISQIKDPDYQVTILVLEDSPRISIKRNEVIVFQESVKSVDDLKIFLEERLYKRLEV